MCLRKRQELNNEVHKINEVYKIVNKVVPLVLAELEPFVGEKIIKVDESLVKKFSDKIEFLVGMRDKIKVKPLEGMRHASCHCLYVQSDKYHIKVKVSASFQISDHGCNYRDEIVYIGQVVNNWAFKGNNGTLESLNSFEPLKMLSASQEWSKYVKAAKAKETLEQATEAMFYSLREWVR